MRRSEKLFLCCTNHKINEWKMVSLPRRKAAFYLTEVLPLSSSNLLRGLDFRKAVNVSTLNLQE